MNSLFETGGDADRPLDVVRDLGRRHAGLSDTMCSLFSPRKSTPPQNREIDILIDHSK